MKRDVFVDFHDISATHDQIHARLVNWARYVAVKRSPWSVHPMWRGYRTSIQWDTETRVRIDIDTLDGHAIEKAVGALPIQNRDALRWYYVKRCSVMEQRRAQGLTAEGLDKAVRDGRTMLVNRLAE